MPGSHASTQDDPHVAGPLGKVRDADEILIGSRGRGRTRSVIGSVSQAVLHRTDRPVRIITERAAARHARTAVPAP